MRDCADGDGRDAARPRGAPPLLLRIHYRHCAALHCCAPTPPPPTHTGSLAKALIDTGHASGALRGSGNNGGWSVRLAYGGAPVSEGARLSPSKAAAAPSVVVEGPG